MESGAILLYLAETHDRFQGDDRWQTLEWLMLQMGGVGPMLGQAHHFLRFNAGKAPYAEQRYAAEAKRLYAVLDKRLADRDYLSGSYSIADMATWPWIFSLRVARHRLGRLPEPQTLVPHHRRPPRRATGLRRAHESEPDTTALRPKC